MAVISQAKLSLDLSDNKSTLVQVMAWCRQATSHYLSQCWPRSRPPNGVTRPQWVNWIDIPSGIALQANKLNILISNDFNNLRIWRRIWKWSNEWAYFEKRNKIENDIFSFAAADFCGEKLAWFFGITSPKYQYYIDEYNHMKAEVRLDLFQQ